MKQGSVLSPVLFLIVMDPLLKKLEESKSQVLDYPCMTTMLEVIYMQMISGL